MRQVAPRLRDLHLDRLIAGHLRTMRRFMKVRRLTMVHGVLLGLLLASMELVP